MTNKTTTALRIEPKVVEPELIESIPPAAPNIVVWPEGADRPRKVTTTTMHDGSIRHNFS
ncbi:hypothetical protein [Reyranella sp. CPCC 100927]|uniref:hypothetical protein n=1 Tax=Reyranella sp. CPCC 100927 TaxID=2599616 RepID=UPI0011B4861B|nr:hypothetical protein [Reyranella sp. CPCC 100927]TWT10631.1 hypothetical protein FQU96_16055 [Reyranella sp. CPCC 100927]